MARFVFIVPPLAGHINPTLSVGAELLQRGHEVGWISLDESLQQRLPTGGELLLIQYALDDREKQDGKQYLDLVSQKNVYGIESIKFLYDDVLIPLNRHMFDGIAAWLDNYQPDVVIHDHQLFAGAMAAHKKQIPYITSVTAPAAIQDDLPAIHQWGVNKVLALQQELNIEADNALICSDLMALVFTTKAFFGDIAMPAHYQFVGPVLQHVRAAAAFDWERLKEMPPHPSVLVSIGTTFNHEHKKDFFAKVITALKDKPVNVIVVSDPQLFDTWPANFLVQEKVPQLELLPLLDAVICHGGHNTVAETLTHGLPLVVIPIAYDQSYVAGQVAASNSGLRLNFKRFKAEHLEKAVWEILGNDLYRTSAKQMQASFAAAGGTSYAASLLEQIKEALVKKEFSNQ